MFSHSAVVPVIVNQFNFLSILVLILSLFSMSFVLLFIAAHVMFMTFVYTWLVVDVSYSLLFHYSFSSKKHFGSILVADKHRGVALMWIPVPSVPSKH